MAAEQERVNILLVDDQPAKLLAYEVILKELGENLIMVSSGRAALECLLKTEVAVVLVDVCMPELDGFELAAMVREHPRFQKTAMIFISAVQVSDFDSLRGYEMGAVDYVPVPVIPEVLRAKVKVFAELYRKTRQLERLNLDLEARVRARTSELERSTARLLESEQRRTLALSAGRMGSWDWDRASGDWMWDKGQYLIFGVDPANFLVRLDNVRALVHPDDIEGIRQAVQNLSGDTRTFEVEFRILQPAGDVRWCMATAAADFDDAGQLRRISGVTIDITERRQAEERQSLLAKEVDHRAKNALALVQSIVRLTRAKSIETYINAIEGRITALARVHSILSLAGWQSAEITKLVHEELAPYGLADQIGVAGPEVQLLPATAQTVALALHELATNATKYGALSTLSGRLSVSWSVKGTWLELLWEEQGGPLVSAPSKRGFGTRSVIASVESQLGGHAGFDWGPQGLRCHLSIPGIEMRDVHEPALPRQLASEH